MQAGRQAAQERAHKRNRHLTEQYRAAIAAESQAFQRLTEAREAHQQAALHAAAREWREAWAAMPDPATFTWTTE